MDTREISYGGLLSFAVPAGWVEEYDEEGGGVFYDDRPDSGTLRLDVATMEAPEQVTAANTAGMLAQVAEVAVQAVVTLPSGNLLAKAEEAAEEEGEPVTLHWWYLANPQPPAHMRLAIFSYTLPRATADAPAGRAELDFVEQAVRAARFAPALLEGEVGDDDEADEDEE